MCVHVLHQPRLSLSPGSPHLEILNDLKQRTTRGHVESSYLGPPTVLLCASLYACKSVDIQIRMSSCGLQKMC